MIINSKIFDTIEVSYYKNIYRSDVLRISISRVLKGIQSGYFRNQILQLRSLLRSGLTVEASKIKLALHAVTFSGLFLTERKAEACSCYNNLMVIDIDKLDNMQMANVEQVLLQDPYVAAFWISPSGFGYKGLVYLSFNDSVGNISNIVKHKIAFRSLFQYLLGTYGIELDKSGSDISRLCFMSWDENIVIKNNFESYTVENTFDSNKESKKIRERVIVDSINKCDNWNKIIGEAKHYNHHQEYRTKLQFIYKKLLKRNLSITDTYESWVKVAFAIASNIHPDKGRELFLKLCELDGINNDAKRSEKLIFDAYSTNKGLVGFNTIVYLARQKGIDVN